MREYLNAFLIEFGYEKDDTDTILKSYDNIINNSRAHDVLEQILIDYNENMYASWEKQIEKMNLISEITDIHKYTASLVVCICLSKKLKEYYKENNIPLNIWHDTMFDFKYKLNECRLVKGICGTFVREWYGKFFVLNLFALGRLQFRINTLRYEYIKNKSIFKIGDQVIDIHIPRSGTPIDKNSCFDSYKRAKCFFENKFKDKPMPFVCSSWLLADENKNMLSEKSNIRRFISDFDIIHTSYFKEGDYSEAWRLFDMDYTGNLDDFPENTSFRKEYKAYLKNGGRIGCGYGIFIM